ncbi:NR LBD domain-containing protein [Caenorhabditis elegans]|uniref:NR LBD domain-containing protein n=1 Tax=Caenorhabditis elegans TaxID=6239 RepID=O16961_CAEEL|nr:NR LBD domain-containing protein [Caenorhabditis elegans]CCD64489.1 NR LBD domain-containing protein [Caenorhabditis elegans]|eukprot:NP_503237.3 Nuclear Hormone Receptor family [Caenorhabditis elegans]
MDQNGPECEVCGLESQGFHFGVLSCRACSAFFRRTATVPKWHQKNCQKPSKCKNGEGQYHCKPCRLKRCIAVGMNTENFQFDRDGLVAKLKKPKLPKSFEMFVGRPEYVLFCTPGTSAQISNPKTLIDVSGLVNKASNVLLTGPEIPIIARDQLHKLAIGFSFLENTSTNMKDFPHSSKEDVLKIWEFYFLTVARWLTYFDEFQKLDHKIQMTLLLAIWHVWGRLDKLLATAINRRRGLCPTKNLLTLSNGVFIDMEHQEVDVDWMTNYEPEQVLTFIDGVRARELTKEIDPLVELEPSDIESAYMLAQLCFHYAGKRFAGEIQEICDHLQDVLAQNLHEYYQNEKKIDRYSGRLAKLIKINGAVQKNIWENRSKIKISKTFDMLSIETSHPEMFYDTGF